MSPVTEEDVVVQPASRLQASVQLNLLVVIDPSEPSARAVRYLAEFFGGRKDTRYCLTPLTPKLPAKLLETGGAEQPQREKRIEVELREAQERWMADAVDGSVDIVEAATTTLRRAGAPAQAISVCQISPQDNRTLVDELLIVASQAQCRTIVVGHFAHSWFSGMGGGHLAERLVRDAKGFAVWVID
jgi:nucleotide-binding universal stress UspA family protein